MSWKVEVQADRSGTWASNALRFSSKRKAESYADDLTIRWTSVRLYRVVEVEDPVNEGRQA